MKNKSIFVVFLTILISIGIVGTVFAADFGMKLTADKTAVKQGDTITIKATAEEINKSKNLVNVFKCVLNYDEEIFEKITEDNIHLLNSWSSLIYNKDEKIITANKYGETQNEEEIFEITFKVKKTTKVGETQINIKEVQSSENGKSTDGEAVSLTIKIDEKNNTGLIVAIIVAAIITSLTSAVFAFVITKKHSKEK